MIVGRRSSCLLHFSTARNSMLDTEKFFRVSSLSSLVNIPSFSDYFAARPAATWSSYFVFEQALVNGNTLATVPSRRYRRRRAYENRQELMGKGDGHIPESTPQRSKTIGPFLGCLERWVPDGLMFYPWCIFFLEMLNDNRKFDYRIKCSFSFSFVSHSILDFSRNRSSTGW